jgi:N6-L-threonylcarbamoyladenine synthase
MLCLGIETSCDETGLALVRDGRLIGQQLASQVRKHAVFGGVVPELASREHNKALWPLFHALLTESGVARQEIQGVAVARGPGLLGSLLVGMALGKGLAMGLGVPIVGVDHLQAHLLGTGLEHDLRFPALGLIISGGHTQLYRIQSEFEFELLGRTLDDAVGEAFDKAAKLLNLPYPGGMILDQLAQLAEPDRSMFACPYCENANCDFSFSGLKTAVANHITRNAELVQPRMEQEPDPGSLAVQNPELARFCASLNWTLARTLCIKVKRAFQAGGEVRTLIVSGGVAANSMIRHHLFELARDLDIELMIPSPHLCTDNGAVIAYQGWVLLNKGYSHSLALDAVPRGRPIPWDYEGPVS